MGPPRFLFISGRPAIDLAQTGGFGRFKKWERLAEPADLIDWLKESALSVDVARVSAHELADAHRLREAIWYGARAVLRGRAVPRRLRERINEIARRPGLVVELRGGRRRWAPGARAGQALSDLARDAIEILGGPLRARLRECENPRCPLLFIDLSRPGRRSWCAMRRCGNIDKTARYRRRRRAAEGSES